MYIKKYQSLKIAAVLSMVCVLLAGTLGSVSAAEFPTGETIPSGETIDDDVFISGENVVVDGTVNGALFAFAETVELNGTVNGDAILGGQEVIVGENAVIDGNLFVGAANIVVNGTVTGTVFGGSTAMTLGESAAIDRNFFYGGFSLTTEEGSAIGKDLYAGNYQSILSGDIARDLNLGAGAVQLNGSIGRDAMVAIGDEESQDGSAEWMQFNPYFNQYVSQALEPGVHVAESASIGGKTVYTSSIDRSNVFESVTTGAVIYQTPVPGTSGKGIRYSMDDVKPFNQNAGRMYARFSVMNTVRNFIKLMAVGALILWLLRKPFMKVVEAAYAQPMKAIGWGFIIIAVGFVALFIIPLVFVMIGVLIGIISLGSLLYVWFGLVGTALLLAVMLFFFTVFTVSKIIAAYMFGRWIMKAVFKEEAEKVWLNLLVGLFVFTLLRAIPFAGFLVGFAATLIGTGAFWLALQKKK